MRIRISHATTYRYDAPVKSVTQVLRLTPRNHEGQYVVSWHIDLSADCPLLQQEDAFGNITHIFTADARIGELKVGVEGVVETQDTNGMIAGAVERFPSELFLRETPLTQADAALTELAAKAQAASDGNRLGLLHHLLATLHRDIVFDTDPTQPTTTAAEAYALGRGVCQDITHIFIAASRAAGIPARYIGGHFYRADGVTAQDAGHAWAEAYVEDLGWLGFDPTNGICTTEAHVRVAMGLDYLGASPVRGTRYGGAGETMTVEVHVDQAQRQTQS
jgi:transglutaminase-like putative cysteine protease